MKELSMEDYNDITKLALDECTLYDKSYPIALAKFIKGCKPPITIALQGEWGSGKTTMMNMVRDSLKDTDVDYMDFNPWLFSQFNLGDQLPLILLTHLSKDTGFYNNIKDFSKKIGVTAAQFVGKMAGGTDNFLSTFTPDDIRKLENLKKEFEITVDNRLKSTNKTKLLIFIDDIDRLLPSKAVELLESIKLFCECKNCVFVLAVDYDVILKGAKDKFGDDKGQAFFDKIIQVPFNMPVSNSKFNEFMSELLTKVLTDINDEKDKEKIKKCYIDICKNTIGSNPRSIKRLLNSFVITDFVAINQELYDANSTINHYIRLMLFYLLAIENCNEDMYTYIIGQINIIEEQGFNNYIGYFKSIINNSDDGARNDFINYLGYDDINLNSNNINNAMAILENYIDLLLIINERKNNKDINRINKLFNISSTAITKEKKKNRHISDDLKKCYEDCDKQLNDIVMKLKDIGEFKHQKGYDWQHKPQIYYKNVKYDTRVFFTCYPKENNYNNVYVDVVYYKDKMNATDLQLFNRINDLIISDKKSDKNRTTGAIFREVISYPIENLISLKFFIKENFTLLNKVFE